MGDATAGADDAALPGVVSAGVELVFEGADGADPLRACKDAAIYVFNIGGGNLTVDGATVARGGRAKLAPGAVLTFGAGDASYTVLRNEHAHA